MRKIFFLLTFFTFLVIFSQQKETTYIKVNYKEIKKKIEDKDSKLYYPKIIERIQKQDSTLTNEEFFYAYHGAVVQKNYAPYTIKDEENNYHKILKEKGLESKDVTPALEKFVQENPLSLEPRILLVMNYEKTGNIEMSKKTGFIFGGLLRAIISSGKGKTCEESMNVNMVSDEYVVVNVMGYQPAGQSLIQCENGTENDFIKFQKNDDNIEGVYFNITQMFENMMKGLK